MVIDSYMNYVYDGTFYGLLTVIHEIYYLHAKPVSISANSDIKEVQSNFLYEYKFINTNSEKAAKVKNAIQNKIGLQALEKIYLSYLSNLDNKELVIYNYIKLGFKLGTSTDKHLYTVEVSSINKIVNKVNKEVMNMAGFIRFTYKNNFYYAAYEPDHNITEILAVDFVDRFTDQYFIIHDVRRNIAVLYDTKEWVITNFCESQLKFLDSINVNNDIFYETLWKEYFKNTAIVERRNDKQQNLHMPKRYWKNILETK